MSKIFTQSAGMKKEYCITVVQIGEVNPIEGSDFLGMTLVNGFPIVVRKDQVKEGDLMFYASNECQLNADFLRLNSLYEDRTMNADPNQKGYFNRYGRVRMVKLRGQMSMGYLFGLNEIMTYLGSYVAVQELNHELDGMVGADFDTVNDQLFVKAYVPMTRENRHVGQGKGEKATKKLKRFDRMIPGEFTFHYETDQFAREVHRFKPEDQVAISVKLHGTSAIFGNIKVREPKWSGLYEKYFMYLPKFLQFTKDRYDYIYSSRTVIKNKHINDKVTVGYYGADVWAQYNELLKKYDVIPEGVTLYGEIVGYTDAGSPIQKMGSAFDYGCEVGKSQLMIYRIVEEMENGEKYEYDVPEVKTWVENTILSCPDLREHLRPIDILYVGTLKDLYPDLDPTNHWHENLLQRMRGEKVWSMEELEPFCKNKLPREGVVIRKIADPMKEAFKLKCMKFLGKEAEKMDKGESDTEMEEAYA